jgi:hypothetical protein
VQEKRRAPVQYVGPEELPDYLPVFAAGAVRADGDGNLWVRTISPTPLAGGAIYHVIDRRGIVIDRVQMSRGTALAGFAPGGVVYAGHRDSTWLRLERTRWRPPRQP